jgi:hypothetical protein
MGFLIILCEILLIFLLGGFAAFVQDTSAPVTKDTTLKLSGIRFVLIIILTFISFILGFILGYVL